MGGQEPEEESDESEEQPEAGEEPDDRATDKTQL